MGKQSIVYRKPREVEEILATNNVGLDVAPPRSPGGPKVPPDDPLGPQKRRPKITL